MSKTKTGKHKIKIPKDKPLTGRQRRRLAEAVYKAKSQGKIAMSAQQTIPYKEMRPDGICCVTDTFYTKTIRFLDINYQLARNEDKNTIFENYCNFLNYFDKSISVQLSFINQTMNVSEFEKTIDIPLQNDKFVDIRAEYTQMLKDQLARGNNGLVKHKYITFGIEAENLPAAKQKLERIEANVLNNFKILGVQAFPLNGIERLELLHSCFNVGEPDNKFMFSWNMIHKTGLSTKDFIAPTSFNFSEGRTFRMGKKIGAVSFLQILAPELTDRMLVDFLDLQNNLSVNIHIRSIDQTEAIKTIKRKITDIDKMKIEEQKKAVRAGYDMDIIPSDLATYGGEAKRLLEDLQSRNERMFLVTILVMTTADNKRELDNIMFAAQSIAQQNNCPLRRLDYQQEAGLMSSVPIGVNQIEIQRSLTTSSTAIFVPFTTQELFSDSPEALYCGLNALSNNMIMVDRKLLKNPNGLILGTPGSGKSFSAKREIANAFLVTKDDIFIGDPEAEYYPLVHQLGGQVIRLSPTSKDYVNPMDINLNYSDEENPLALKSDFILSLCELIIGGRTGLEMCIRDRAVMDGGKCILQLRGVRPFLSDKYDITKHPRYKYLADYDERNKFDMERYMKRRKTVIKPDEVFDYYDIVLPREPEENIGDKGG